jgi:hypothetical protein
MPTCVAFRRCHGRLRRARGSVRSRRLRRTRPAAAGGSRTPKGNDVHTVAAPLVLADGLAKSDVDGALGAGRAHEDAVELVATARPATDTTRPCAPGRGANGRTRRRSPAARSSCTSRASSSRRNTIETARCRSEGARAIEVGEEHVVAGPRLRAFFSVVTDGADAGRAQRPRSRASRLRAREISDGAVRFSSASSRPPSRTDSRWTASCRPSRSASSWSTRRSRASMRRSCPASGAWSAASEARLPRPS